MQSINIDVKKILKDALYPGEKGLYLNLVLHENKTGRDQYGNDGFVTQDLGKERRLAGEKSPILGNWKHIGAAKTVDNTITARATNSDIDNPFL
jgi:hypothetical protein